MGTIQKRVTSNGAVSYTARVRRRGFPQLAVTFSRITDAKAWISQEEIKIRQGIHLDQAEAKKHTINEAIERFVREEGANERARLHFRRWSEKLGSQFLAAITDVSLDQAISDFRHVNKFQASTINVHLAALSSLMRRAKQWGWIKRNPVLDVKRPRPPKGRVRFLSDDERERLLRGCEASGYPQLYLIVVLALSTGMRKEEILSLKWNDVELKDGVIILQNTKNKERRRVAVRGLALDLLRQHAKVRRIDSDFLFPGERPSPQKDCTVVHKSDRHFDIRKPWVRALNLASIEDFVFHDLRHSCASYLAMGGASPLEIAEVLGHKSLDMVKRYAHLAESHVASVVERMNKSIFG